MYSWTGVFNKEIGVVMSWCLGHSWDLGAGLVWKVTTTPHVVSFLSNLSSSFHPCNHSFYLLTFVSELLSRVYSFHLTWAEEFISRHLWTCIKKWQRKCTQKGLDLSILNWIVLRCGQFMLITRKIPHTQMTPESWSAALSIMILVWMEYSDSELQSMYLRAKFGHIVLSDQIRE